MECIELNWLCKHKKGQKQSSFYFNKLSYWMNSVKHSFSLWVLLKVTIQKNWRSQNFNFWSLKNSLLDQFLSAPTHPDIIGFQNFFLQIKNKRSRTKSLCDFSIILILKGIISFESQRIHAFYWAKTKNETESKIENPTYTPRETSLALQFV